MDEQIRQIGERLRGLREVLDIPAEEVAELCDITPEHYMKIESGEADPSVYRLSKIAKRYGIALDVLMFGEEPRMSSRATDRAWPWNAARATSTRVWQADSAAASSTRS